MSRFNDSDDPRRQFLLQLLAAGLLSAGVPSREATASLFGKSPQKLPPGRSIHDLDGEVRVNSALANLDSRIGPNDTVETGKDGYISFAVGQDAFLLRSNSRLVLAGQKDGAVNSLTLLLGKLLTVFGKREHKVRTPLAIVGVRGTGVYVESEPDQTYFCTCYGAVDVTSARDKNSRESIASKHHDKPLYILASAASGKYIRPAPFKNHTDMELQLIEELVGRTPPFVFSADDYVAPRRDY
jgi:hypothetical protein